MKFLIGVLFVLLGLIICLQASDMNPLLLNPNYSAWLNKTLSHLNGPMFGLYVLLCIIFGIIFASQGLKLMQEKLLTK